MLPALGRDINDHRQFFELRLHLIYREAGGTINPYPFLGHWENDQSTLSTPQV